MYFAEIVSNLELNVYVWEQTAIIALYKINWLVLVTETECVYCAVRTGCLHVIQGSNIF